LVWHVCLGKGEKEKETEGEVTIVPGLYINIIVR